MGQPVHREASILCVGQPVQHESLILGVGQPVQPHTQLPCSVWTRHGAVKQGKSEGSIGTTSGGRGRGCGEVRIGQGGRGRAQGGERLMGTAACGGKGFKGRIAVSGDWPIGAASCRPRHDQVSCQTPLPSLAKPPAPHFQANHVPPWVSGVHNYSSAPPPLTCMYVEVVRGVVPRSGRPTMATGPPHNTRYNVDPRHPHTPRNTPSPLVNLQHPPRHPTPNTPWRHAKTPTTRRNRPPLPNNPPKPVHHGVMPTPPPPVLCHLAIDRLTPPPPPPAPAPP